MGNELSLNCYCDNCGNPVISPQANFNHDQSNLSRQLENYLKGFDEHIQRVSIKYDEFNRPFEVKIYMMMVTGSGNKGPYSYYPPDEFISEIWENKKFKVSFRGKMHYYPHECTDCNKLDCSNECNKVEIGAKWILGEKTVALDNNETTFEEIASKLLTNI